MKKYGQDAGNLIVDLLGDYTRALKQAVGDAKADGFGSGITRQRYTFKDKEGGPNLEVSYTLSFHVKQAK